MLKRLADAQLEAPDITAPEDPASRRVKTMEMPDGEEQSANWTCVGIRAHQSALNGGEIVRLPEFRLG